MTVHDRREPVLDEEELPEGTEPLLLQDLVREGLPPPLWRRRTHSPEKTPQEEGPAPAEGKSSLAVEPSAPMYTDHEAETGAGGRVSRSDAWRAGAGDDGPPQRRGPSARRGQRIGCGSS